jgi:hypothetical protein
MRDESKKMIPAGEHGAGPRGDEEPVPWTFRLRDAENWLRRRGFSRRRRNAATAMARRLPGVRRLPQWALRRVALVCAHLRG